METIISNQIDNNQTFEMTVGEIEQNNDTNKANEEKERKMLQQKHNKMKSEHALKPLFPAKNNTKNRE